jgi:hypothetical protein
VCIFIAAGTCLPSRYLAKIEDYTDTQTVKWSHKYSFILFLNSERRLKM